MVFADDADLLDEIVNMYHSEKNRMSIYYAKAKLGTAQNRTETVRR